MVVAVSGQWIRTFTRTPSNASFNPRKFWTIIFADNLRGLLTSSTSHDRTVSNTYSITARAGGSPPALGSAFSTKNRRINQFRFCRQPGKMADSFFSTLQSSRQLKRLKVMGSRFAAFSTLKSVCLILPPHGRKIPWLAPILPVHNP